MIYIDVSDLPAPEPLEKVLDLLSHSNENDVICMIHRQRPCALFPILKDKGYTYLEVEKNKLINIYIWNSKNKEAPVIVEEDVKSVR